MFQGYLVYGEFREYISHGLPSLDIDVAEILLEDNTAYTGIGFQGYLDDFSFSIGIGGEVVIRESGVPCVTSYSRSRTTEVMAKRLI